MRFTAVTGFFVLAMLLAMCSTTGFKPTSKQAAELILTVSFPQMVTASPGPLNGEINTSNPGFITGLYGYFKNNYSLQASYVRTWTENSPIGQAAIEVFVFPSAIIAESAYSKLLPSLKEVKGQFVSMSEFKVLKIKNAFGQKLVSISPDGKLKALQIAFNEKNAIFIVQVQSLSNIFNPDDAENLAVKQYNWAFNKLSDAHNSSTQLWVVYLIIGLLLMLLLATLWWFNPYPRRRKSKSI
jgi:hypothetical protein